MSLARVHILRHGNPIPLGLIDSSRIDWGYLSYYERWSMHLTPQAPHSLARADEPVSCIANHATFGLLHPRRERLLFCIDGAKELVDWWAFASFPRGREIVNG